MAATVLRKHSGVFSHKIRVCTSLLRHFSAESLPISKEEIDYQLNGRDIPFLYVPHTTQKAFHVHWSATKLKDVFDKYKWLTKTVSTPELHGAYDGDSSIFKSEGISCLNDSLRQAVAFQKVPKNKNQLRFYNERITHSFFTNVLRIPLILDHESDHLKPENSYLYYKPNLETHWPRNYSFYHCEFRPTFVLKTKNGLKRVEEPEELTPDQVEKIPGPFDPYSMNIYRKSINHLRNRPVSDNSKFNPIKHCHTAIMINNRLLNDQQLLAGGMFTCFAQLVSQALDDGVMFGTDLRTPLVSQCIVTNGHRVAFLVYQLNTMNFLDDKSLWNRVWYTNVSPMYKKKEGDSLFYENADTEEHDLIDKNVANNILQFIGRKTV